MINGAMIACGGFLGVIARAALGRWFSQKSTFPFATLIVNSSGSFLLGILIGWQDFPTAFVGIGFLGSFTTFSTLNWEAIHLARERKWRQLCWYVLGNYAGGILLAGGGVLLGGFL